MNKSGKSGHPCLIPGFRGNAFSIPIFLPGESPWTEESGGIQSMASQRIGHDWVIKHSTFIIEYDVTYWFVSYRLYYVELCSLLCLLSEEFYHKWVLNFVKSLFCIYSDDHIVFILQFVDVIYHTDWFSDTEKFLHPWDESVLIMILLMYHWIQIASILCLCSSVTLACNFLFCICLSGCGIRVNVAS